MTLSPPHPIDGDQKTIQNPKKDPQIQMEPMGWESLPEDLLLIIFGKLAVEKLLIGAPLACRSWYATSLDPSLYKKLDLIPLPKISSSLSGDALTTVQPAAVIRNVVPRGGEGVQRVMLPYRGVSDDNIVYIADRCPNLKSFYLRWPIMISKRAFCMRSENGRILKAWMLMNTLSSRKSWKKLVPAANILFL